MKVKVISTNSSQNTEFEIPETVTTWGQLKSYIADQHGYYFQDNSQIAFMASGDSMNGMSPQLNDSLLPTKEKWVIAVTPPTAKFGAVSYNQMKVFVRDTLHQARLTKNDEVINLIGNYTTLRMTEMVKLYEALVKMTTPVSTTGVTGTYVVTSNTANLGQEVENLKFTVQELKNEIELLKERVSELEDENSWEDDEDESEDEDNEELQEVVEDEDVTAARLFLNR